mmetsp:Transcript_8788/g.24251  ORF Transcript_8788/g.24251 Transcript_8788/m.24251 type:complete len:202 (-) Transcript_8788:167-772(-)
MLRGRRVLPAAIASIGNPVLRQIAAEANPTAPATRRLARQLLATLDVHDALGLSAPQIGVSLRVIVIRDLFNRLDSALSLDPPLGEVHRAHLSRVPPIVAVNPMVTGHSDTYDDDWESCLSVPALHGLVRRPRDVHIRYTTLEGEAVEVMCSGYGARVFQHEVDHLEGILFLDRLMKDGPGLVHEGELEHYIVSDADKASP